MMEPTKYNLSGFQSNMDMVKALCQRFGTTYLAKDRNEKILAGWAALDAKEAELLSALEEIKK